MAKLRLRNVGPIKKGFDEEDGFFSINEVTVFIGNQGTGKSIVSKIYSTLSWLEKALVRGDFKENYLTQYNSFKKQLAYQNISSYVNENSEIEYIGNAFHFEFKSNTLSVSKLNHKDYKFPKIMYVPAERNFVASVGKPDLVKRLPLPLYTFLDEYEEAKKNHTEGINLPIGGIRFEYRKQNKKSWIIGSDFKIELLEASSGFQSLVPLFLVTDNLSKIISREKDNSLNESSLKEKNRIRKQVEEILENNKISDDVLSVLLEKLSEKYTYSCFINIVEEPEQNLFPLSQKDVLFSLLESKNKNSDNKLLITTHSPYIINYLTLSIKGNFILEKAKGKDEIINALDKIVPKHSCMNSEKVSIFQIDTNGNIKPLGKYSGLPSDENYLNNFLSDFNEDFIKLMRIEDLCQ